MDTITARPGLLKQANLTLIRKAVKNQGTATRAQIAQETGISVTTVRSLLAEMMRSGEIESAGCGASSGGRKAERYRLRPDRYHGAAFCIADGGVHCLVVNVCGEIVRSAPLAVQDGNFEAAITAFLDGLVGELDIRAIGVGVPGIVEGGGYWRQDVRSGELVKAELGSALARRYGLPVILENDLNATAIGFGRCYGHEFPEEDPADANMVYLYFERGCVSAGLIAGGQVVRGHRNFAGELGLVPLAGEKNLDGCLDEAADGGRYTDLVIQALAWLCGILNPQYIALGGPAFHREFLGPIGDGLTALLPTQMCAELLYAPDMQHDYHEGMAYLTAGKMFTDIQFIQE